MIMSLQSAFYLLLDTVSSSAAASVNMEFRLVPANGFLDSPRNVRFAAASVYSKGFIYIFGGINHIPCVDERTVTADIVRPSDPVLWFRVGTLTKYYTLFV